MTVTEGQVREVIALIDTWAAGICAATGGTGVRPDQRAASGAATVALAELVDAEVFDSLMDAIGRWALAEALTVADPGPDAEAAAASARAVWAGPLVALVPNASTDLQTAIDAPSVRPPAAPTMVKPT